MLKKWRTKEAENERVWSNQYLNIKSRGFRSRINCRLFSTGRRDEFCRPCDTIPHSLISTGGHSCALWHSPVSVNRIKVDSSVVCFCDWSRDLVIGWYNKIGFNLPEDEMAPRAISYVVVCSGPHAKGPRKPTSLHYLLSYLFLWSSLNLVVASRLDAPLPTFIVSESRLCPHFIKEYRNCYFFTVPSSFVIHFHTLHSTFCIHLPNLFLFLSFYLFLFYFLYATQTTSDSKRLFHRDYSDIPCSLKIKIYMCFAVEQTFSLQFKRIQESLTSPQKIKSLINPNFRVLNTRFMQK